ncbi:unnamed protein product [Closterium sp. NIES-65]|nr:unnamed protein product [Closterium sp. NIES-65]
MGGPAAFFSGPVTTPAAASTPPLQRPSRRLLCGPVAAHFSGPAAPRGLAFLSGTAAQQPSRREAEPPSCRAAKLPSSRAAEPPSSRAAEPPSTQPPSRRAAEQPSRRAAEPPSSRAARAEPPSRPSRAAQSPSRRAAQLLSHRAAEPPKPPCPAIDFDVWVDDLQLFLQCDRADGLSLFDLTSGASPAPAADADATVRSQWATRDAAARLAVRRHLPTSERAHFSQYKSAQTLYDAVVARYSSPATAALSRLMLPYLFPDLAAFPTVADLITYLRTSDTRYRAALPAEFCAKNPPPMYITLYYIVTRLPDSLCIVRDHFLSVCPTTLTVELLEKALLAAEKSIVAVGASRGSLTPPSLRGVPPPPFCPLLPLLLRPASLGLSRSVRRLPLAGDAALATARGAGALEELAGAVEEAVEVVEGVGVAVGVVAEVEVSVAAVEAEAAATVAVGAELAKVAAVAVEVELVGVALRRGSAPVVVSASSSSSTALVTSPPFSSSVSGTLHASEVGVQVRAPTSYAPATAQVSSAGVRTPPSAALAA